ncbi:putative ABC transport system ATP-binding protein [Clostridium cavendishii DSM 21758]|uniref:Putative ABC transport system ATP-binding protein n=1 Tax=Clostridium cavendishii DSM 21758 TaxID=1121302 RepID=A0A1M6JJ70_9CLOT|nr:ATP-binding cassette domain-containing protein [Clostridium cavendishii]SHJ46662.1 putative ABC transport system ATP-binding protein [Clostridium cavendishii DSM 21758]
MAEVIIANNINKKITWAQGVKWDFLKNVNFTIYKGEFITIGGNSGGGKSTLLGILLGYDNDWEGTVLINGINTKNLNKVEFEKFRSENIGICYKEKSTVIFMNTVKENIYSRLNELKNINIKGEYKKILNLFNLTNIQDKKVLLCSPTEFYRLMLAVAFCGPPPIIVIDEILDYFPLYEKQEILDTIMTLQKNYNITLVVVTHDMEIIKKSDRALCVKDRTVYKVDLDKFRRLTEGK